MSRELELMQQFEMDIVEHHPAFADFRRNRHTPELYESDKSHNLFQGWKIAKMAAAAAAGKGLPDGYVMMPNALTAENGAKYLLSGEFFESIELANPEYDTEDSDELEPETFTQKVTVEWNTIKQIYATIVERYGKAPPMSAKSADDLTAGAVTPRIDTWHEDLAKVAEEAAAELEAYATDQYPLDQHNYPSVKRGYDSGMDTVNRIRVLLESDAGRQVKEIADLVARNDALLANEQRLIAELYTLRKLHAGNAPGLAEHQDTVGGPQASGPPVSKPRLFTQCEALGCQPLDSMEKLHSVLAHMEPGEARDLTIRCFYMTDDVYSVILKTLPKGGDS